MVMLAKGFLVFYGVIAFGVYVVATSMMLADRNRPGPWQWYIVTFLVLSALWPIGLLFARRDNEGRGHER